MRTTRRRADRAVMIGVAAALLALAACDGGDEAPATDQPPAATATTQAEANAAEIATGFVEAFGAFDGERAITYLADGAFLGMDASTPEEVPVFTSFLAAQGYEQNLVDACRVTGTSASGTAVRCRFDWHAIRSDEIGLGPYPGSWDLTVRDGEIVSVSLYWDIEKFSPQMWEPFSDWVSKNYPKDFKVMYKSDFSSFRLTGESIRLWGQRTREYVEEVAG